MRACASCVLFFSLAGALLSGCGKAGDSQTSAQNVGVAKVVEIANARLHPMSRVIMVTGTLAAQEQSILSAKVAGRLHYLPVDLGSLVRQGDVLAQIEPTDYELGLQQAAAAL